MPESFSGSLPPLWVGSVRFFRYGAHSRVLLAPVHVNGGKHIWWLLRRGIENLKLLAAHTPQEHITIRLPLIPNYNNEKHREASINTLRNIGFKNFDMLKYITPAP